MTNSQVFSIKNVSTFPVSNFAQSHCIFFHTKSAGHFWMAWQKKVHMSLSKSHRMIAERFDHSCEFYKKNWPNSFTLGLKNYKADQWKMIIQLLTQYDVNFTTTSVLSWTIFICISKQWWWNEVCKFLDPMPNYCANESFLCLIHIWEGFLFTKPFEYGIFVTNRSCEESVRHLWVKAMSGI